MASYHCTVKAGAKGKASAHADYISRAGKYSEGDRYEDLEASAYGNMPKWSAHNPAHFWSASDKYERVNGTAYREIEVALPREFTPSQRLELVQEFIKQELGDKHAYQFAIHKPNAAIEDGEQPHAHIMFSERIRDGIDRDPDEYFKRYNAKTPEKGGCKKASGGKLAKERKAELVALRERWAEVQNKHLEKHGHNDRVDHRSLKDQGINREPEKHLGALGVRNLNTHDISVLLEHRAAEGEQEMAQREVSIIDLSGDLKKAKTDRLDESQKIQKALSLNQPSSQQETIEHKREPSLEERIKSLEQKVEAFKERQEELKLEIEHIADEKIKGRLQLEADLESFDFTRTNKMELAGILTEVDRNKNAYDIAILKHEAKNADQKHKECEDELNSRAVRDDDYKPRDQRSADKVDKMKKAEKEKWSKFEDEAKNNEWSEDRYKQERQKLQEKMDRQIAYDFDLKTNRNRDRGMGR
jgi:MobA/MobL family